MSILQSVQGPSHSPRTYEFGGSAKVGLVSKDGPETMWIRENEKVQGSNFFLQSNDSTSYPPPAWKTNFSRVGFPKVFKDTMNNFTRK
jgi:hypothetical protein